MFALWSQVTHLLPANKTNLDDYILLHPDAAKYIWFPDIYIGKQLALSIYSRPQVEIEEYLCLRSLRGQFIVICCNNF